MSTDKKCFFIGPLILDQRAGYLRNIEGEAVHLRNKTYQVLVFLAQRHNEMVSRFEIADAIWKDRYVTDDSLTQCVREIRKVLGDGEKRVLQTVHCTGYRLVCDVDDDSAFGQRLVFETDISATSNSGLLVNQWAMQPVIGMKVTGYRIGDVQAR